MSVVVVGSINLDVTVPVPTPPAAGQTLLGGAAARSGGGKGANQAVAAARLGRTVHMVGAVGTDAEGDWLLERLRSDDVDVSAVVRADTTSGQAYVFISAGGESTIVVAPGANMALTPQHVSSDLVAGAGVLLVQQEIPSETVAAAVTACRGRVILNPAPARPLDHAVLAGVDVLIPNRDELAALAGVRDLADLAQVAHVARGLGVRGDVVVTLGADGALVVEPHRHTHVPAADVVARDATAAGDSFCAGIADALLDGAEVVEAARWATRIAAVTVTRNGAMDSLPFRADLQP